MPISIEQHVEWIADCLAYLQEHDLGTIEPGLEAEYGWVAHVNEVADKTLFRLANSWYVGANIPGKPRVFMPYVGGVGNYRKICADGSARRFAAALVGDAAGSRPCSHTRGGIKAVLFAIRVVDRPARRDWPLLPHVEQRDH